MAGSGLTEEDGSIGGLGGTIMGGPGGFTGSVGSPMSGLGGVGDLTGMLGGTMMGGLGGITGSVGSNIGGGIGPGIADLIAGGIGPSSFPQVSVPQQVIPFQQPPPQTDIGPVAQQIINGLGPELQGTIAGMNPPPGIGGGTSFAGSVATPPPIDTGFGNIADAIANNLGSGMQGTITGSPEAGFEGSVATQPNPITSALVNPPPSANPMDQTLMEVTLSQILEALSGNGPQTPQIPQNPGGGLPGGLPGLPTPVNRQTTADPALDYVPGKYMQHALELAGLQGKVKPGGPAGILPPGGPLFT